MRRGDGHAILAKIIIKQHKNIFFLTGKRWGKDPVRRPFFATKVHCTVDVLSSLHVLNDLYLKDFV